MQRRLIYPKEVTDQEARRLAKPAAIGTLFLCLILVLTGFFDIFSSKSGFVSIGLGIAWMGNAVVLYYGIMPSPKRLQTYKWPIIIFNIAAISVGLIWLPSSVRVIPQIILLLVAVIVLILWDRFSTYTFISITGIAHLLIIFGTNRAFPFLDALINSSFYFAAIIVVETLQRQVVSNLKRIMRLKAINEFARQVSATLDADAVLDMIGAAIRNVLQADTYFWGLVDGDELQMKLIFDEGITYPPESAPLEGTLSGWVIRHQQSLFIADLRNDVELDGVRQVLMGKAKTSLCWMGVPLLAGPINGVIAIASYTPNDFNRADLELLENLAKQAALVLDNAHHHAEVEAQSRLDSLTGAYNHGYVVHILNREAENCQAEHTPLSLIMLDIDYFKRYNDNYGHLVGDQVLTVLTQTIRQHIKSSDSIGRWGGEEFMVVLPGANGLQAHLVAGRIQETVSSLSIQDRNGQVLPFPTVSQGLAVFPDEASDVHKLIDLADQRLYVAKERGRNQVEPKQEHWKYIK